MVEYVAEHAGEDGFYVCLDDFVDYVCCAIDNLSFSIDKNNPVFQIQQFNY